jgi:hypothetical protein
MDLLDPSGSGFVMVWSRGLPFLRGSRDTIRTQFRYSLHIATYAQGKCRQYLLQEFPQEAVELDERTGNARFGRSEFHVESTGSETKLQARLDIDLPERGDRWMGEVELRGPTVRFDGVHERRGNAHTWCPISVHAQGEVDLRSQKSRFSARGGAYFDSNSSATPLHEEAIPRWDWGRVQFPDRTLVYYLVGGESKPSPDSLLLEADGQGSTLCWAPDTRRSRRTFSKYGVRTPRQIELTEKGYQIRLVFPVDIGPFYERYLLEARGPRGETGLGIGEVVLPGRIDQPWMRPFVRMKTHHLTESNSMWLPLFSGVSDTPLVRLWRSLRRPPHVD